MGIASLVLGVVSVVLGIIPFCGVIGVLPGVVGLVLGIIDLVNKAKVDGQKGMTIAGTILSGVAIFIILLWCFFIALFSY